MGPSGVRPPPPFWVVGGSAAIAAIAGSILALQLAIWTNPTQFVGGPSSGVGPGLDTRFVAIYYGVPISAFGASIVAYVGTVARRPWVAATAAVVTGIVLGGVVGAESTPIAKWWLANVSNATVASWAAGGIITLLPMALAATLLSVKIPIAWSPMTARGRFATFLAFGAFVGSALGMLLLSEVQFIWALQSQCTSPYQVCSNGGAMNLAESGAVIGAWVGGALGLLVGACVAAVPPRAGPHTGTAPR